jgi:hypothetical protein
MVRQATAAASSTWHRARRCAAIDARLPS